MTLVELMDAMEGYAESKGAKVGEKPLTPDEVDGLFADLDENGALIVEQKA